MGKHFSVSVCKARPGMGSQDGKEPRTGDRSAYVVPHKAGRTVGKRLHGRTKRSYGRRVRVGHMEGRKTLDQHDIADSSAPGGCRGTFVIQARGSEDDHRNGKGKNSCGRTPTLPHRTYRKAEDQCRKRLVAP